MRPNYTGRIAGRPTPQGDPNQNHMTTLEKTMRAILIDPHARTVTEICHDGTLPGLYSVLACDTIDAVRLGIGVVGYVDDEGLLKPNRFFAFFDFQAGEPSRPFAGRMVLLGTDDEGNNVDLPAFVTLSAVRGMVVWPTPDTMRGIIETGAYDTVFSDFSGNEISRVPVRPEVLDDGEG